MVSTTDRSTIPHLPTWHDLSFQLKCACISHHDLQTPQSIYLYESFVHCIFNRITSGCDHIARNFACFSHNDVYIVIK